MPARMKLSSVYSTLPPAERKVADFILANPDDAAHMVINEIARHAGVSVPSVTRLARKLGYSGFMDFRVSLASGTSNVKRDSGNPITSEDTDEVLIQKLLMGHMAAIEATMKVLDPSKLAALAQRILLSDRVVWFGVGSCAKLCHTISDTFCRMEIDSVVVDNRSIMHPYAKNLKPGDIVIAVTRTGKTQRTVDALKVAKANGAETVLITNLVNSPGEQYANYFICASRQDELYRISGYETFTSICALLETLLTVVERHKGFSSRTQFLDTVIAHN